MIIPFPNLPNQNTPLPGHGKNPEANKRLYKLSEIYYFCGQPAGENYAHPRICFFHVLFKV